MSIHKGIRYWVIGIILAAILLSACGGSDSRGSSEEQRPASGAPTAAVSNPSYPAPPTRDPSYPAPATPFPTVDPYPGGVAVIVHPLGEQCSDDAFFTDAADAADQLEAEGIQVLGVGEVDLGVCSACGCPTSAHVRLEINPDDLAVARSLGWSRGQ